MWIFQNIPNKAELRLTCSHLFCGWGRNEWFLWGKRYLYCVPAWRVTDWHIVNSRRASWLHPCCVCAHILHLKKALSNDNTETLRPECEWLAMFSEVRLHVYDDAGMSSVWKCDWNALTVCFKWVFFSSFYLKNDKHPLSVLKEL